MRQSNGHTANALLGLGIPRSFEAAICAKLGSLFHKKLNVMQHTSIATRSNLAIAAVNTANILLG
jgi:hypothetical protein